jgi:hypothetical protein
LIFEYQKQDQKIAAFGSSYMKQKAHPVLLMTQRKPSPADSVKLAAEILPGGQHDYPTSLLAH